MTTATVAPPDGNQFAVLLAMFLLVALITVVVLWMHERRWDAHDDKLTGHDEQLATLAGRIQSLTDFLGVDVHDAVDDSPAAMAEEPDTDEFPAVPATEPSGIPIQVHSALIARPSPVPRDLAGEFPSPFDSAERKAKRAADIEERLKSFNFIGGRK